jgi:hypothetical protein
MMNSTIETFIALLRSAVTCTNEEIDLADINYEALFSLAKFHDLAHIVYAELNKRIEHWEGDIYRKFRQQYDMAVYRCIKRDLAIEQLQVALENARIPFVLLKGTYLMKLYPETWMRTSSDVDILVKKEEHHKAADTLQKDGFIKIAETAHDFSFSSPDKYHIELHYSLIEDDKLPSASKVLEKVWDNANHNENHSEEMLNDEMFYFYHLAHMAKHFKDGGCGIRSFIDLWLLNHNIPYDVQKRIEYLTDGGLLAFAKQSESLSEKWFSNDKGDVESPEFEDYIISGGVYGTAEHNVIVRKKQTNNRLVFYFRRIFLPYSGMKYAYPILRECPVLLPIFWVVRWLKILKPSYRKKAANELRIERTADEEVGNNIEMLMKDLKIW